MPGRSWASPELVASEEKASVKLELEPDCNSETGCNSPALARNYWDGGGGTVIVRSDYMPILAPHGHRGNWEPLVFLDVYSFMLDSFRC